MLTAPYDPVPVSDVDVAFPAMALDVMPLLKEIPKKYQVDNAWTSLFLEWFTNGLDPAIEFWMKDGIDGLTAYRHLSVIIGSYAPKHEYKEAAFTFLCSLWFTKVVNHGRTHKEI